MITDDGRACYRAAAAAFGCLLLTVCAAQTTTTIGWVKAGADDQTISRELRDCNAQASAALASEQASTPTSTRRSAETGS